MRIPACAERETLKIETRRVWGTRVTDYGIGARGIDYISSSNGTTTNVGFRCYDSHGNMTACVFRSGSGYSLGNQRSYDAWGNVREGSATGDPKGRYCASLGHKQDDESGLVYMRARYADPTCGRFLSQDPFGNGLNWFAYGDDDPVSNCDEDGRISGKYLLDIYNLLKLAFRYKESAQANPELLLKNILKIKDLIRDIARIGNTAKILGEDVVESSEQTAEDADSKGGLAGLGIDMSMAQAAGGVGTISIKAVASLVIDALKDVLEEMEDGT
jgi:RHS repeat-associated protein